MTLGGAGIATIVTLLPLCMWLGFWAVPLTIPVLLAWIFVMDRAS